MLRPMGQRFRQTLGGNVSEGVRLLWLVMAEKGLTQEDVRNALGVARGVVSRWLYADRQPDLDSAVKMAAEYGIPTESWTVPPSRRFALPKTGTDD